MPESDAGSVEEGIKRGGGVRGSGVDCLARKAASLPLLFMWK